MSFHSVAKIFEHLLMIKGYGIIIPRLDVMPLQFQKIVMYDWLQSWLDEPIPPYERYDPNTHPGVAAVFQSAAMRFGHTLVPPAVYRR